MRTLTMIESSCGRPERWLRLLAVGFCLAMAMPRAAHAQWRDAVAVSVPPAGASQTTTLASLDVAPNGDSWQTGEFWRWTGIGVLAGAVVGAGWVALQIASSKSDDGMISPVIPLLIVGAAGGVGGGLIGALAYVGSHPAPEPPR
jgi:hypothetical protein